jgi:hypothetical protein
VKIASTRSEWEQAFALVADNYQARGYDADGSDYHFTSHHALPDTMTCVAKEDERVLATMSLVADNTLLGLPMESTYAAEVRHVRGAGRRLGEVTSLASTGLAFREFGPVFHALIRLMMQRHLAQGGDSWVITVNPRHSAYYTRVVGFTALGPRRAYAKAQGHPAEAYFLDRALLRARVPRFYEYVFGQPLPPAALQAVRMPADLARYFAGRSCHTDRRLVEEILRHVEDCGSPRLW